MAINITGFEDDQLPLTGIFDSGAMTVDASPAQIVTIMAVQDNIAPVVGLITEGSTTNDDTPTLQGNLSARLLSGQSVHVFRNGVDAGTARVDGTNWVFEDGGLQSGMTYAYTARVMDRQGNRGPESDSISFTLDTSDTQWTIAIEHLVDDVLPVVGDIPNNGVTNDTSPRLTGSLVTRLSAGQKVEVVRDGEVVGAATMTGSTTWYYQDSGLANGHDYTYAARVVDAHGAQITESAAWKITVDTVVPTAKPVITGFVDDQLPQTGEFHSGDSTNDLTPLLHGTVSEPLGPREIVAIYRGGAKIGSVPVHEDGSWSFQDGGLRDGQTYTYTARVEDAAGNRGPASDDFKITIDTTPPAATALVSTIVNDTGVAGDFITSDPTLVVLGTVSATLGAGEKVQISLDGINWHDAVTMGATWGWDNTANTLPDGHYTIQTRVIDLAGNIGPIAEKALVIDTAPLPIPRIDAIWDDVEPFIGIVPNEGTTNDTQPELRGSMPQALAPGQVIEINRSGIFEDVIYLGITLGTATVDSSGLSWSFTDTSGRMENYQSYNYGARVVDAAGNESNPSNFYSITLRIDTPPAAPVINQVTDDFTGFLHITGPIKQGGFTDDLTPTFHGTADANSRVNLYDGTALVASTTADAGGQWRINTVSLGKQTGNVDDDIIFASKTYTAISVDAAGNASVSSAPFAFTVDSGGPPHGVRIDQVIDDMAPVTGVVTNTASNVNRYVGTTDDPTPLLTGKLFIPDAMGVKITTPLREDHGDQLYIFRTGTDSSSMVDTVTVDSTGNWSYQESNLSNGTIYTYVLRVINEAGSSSAQSNQLSLTLDANGILTQPQAAADNAALYASSAGSGVDVLATHAAIGSTAWVHGIGTDTAGATATQHDMVMGGRGNDHIGIIGANFTSISGGGSSGGNPSTDTLAFEGSNLTLDLTAMGYRVSGFERFDLNNQTHGTTAAGDPNGLFTALTQNNTLKLSLADVLSQPDSPMSQLTGGPAPNMVILGDGASTVNLTDAGWSSNTTQTVGGVIYDVWHNAAQGASTVADLLIQQGVHVV